MAYPRLSCEGEAARDLKFISLAVRMKLDLAGFKVNLQDWQAIPVDKRWQLHDMEAESDDAIEQFRRLFEQALKQAARPLPHRLQESELAHVKEWKDAIAVPRKIAALDESQRLKKIGRALIVLAVTCFGILPQRGIYRGLDPRCKNYTQYWPANHAS
jgi:hypothetical protein